MNVKKRRTAFFSMLVCTLLLLIVTALPAAAQTISADEFQLLPFDRTEIMHVGNQTSKKCSLYALRYARTVLDGKACSGNGMWADGAVWSAGGYVWYDGSREDSLKKIYSELLAGRPVIVHLRNVHVSGVSNRPERVTSQEYHASGDNWEVVERTHAASTTTYGHWVCVVGTRVGVDPEHLTESDFVALDPVCVNADGRFSITPLLDGTLWPDSPLRIAEQKASTQQKTPLQTA